MLRRVLLYLSLLLTPALACADDAALYQESYALEAKGDVAGALAAMERANPPGGGDYVFHLRRGWVLYLNGRHAEAAAAYERAVELAPRAVEPRLGATLPLMALRRWDDVERQCGEALRLAPGEFTALSRLAYVHYQQGRYARAEGYYRQALALYPSNVEMRSGLAWSLLQQGKRPEAREAFTALLAVAPGYTSAQQGLAQAKE